MTFSVCTRIEGSEGTSFGIGVATDAPAVGALAPFVGERGAVCTQSFVNVRLGRRGIDLLSDLAVGDALGGLLAQDERSDLRQVHGIDARARRMPSPARTARSGSATGWKKRQASPRRGTCSRTARP